MASSAVKRVLSKLPAVMKAIWCRWVTNGLAFVCTALLSEWLCLRRELRDIPIGAPPPSPPPGSIPHKKRNSRRGTGPEGWGRSQPLDLRPRLSPGCNSPYLYFTNSCDLLVNKI